MPLELNQATVAHRCFLRYSGVRKSILGLESRRDHRDAGRWRLRTDEVVLRDGDAAVVGIKSVTTIESRVEVESASVGGPVAAPSKPAIT